MEAPCVRCFQDWAQGLHLVFHQRELSVQACAQGGRERESLRCELFTTKQNEIHLIFNCLRNVKLSPGWPKVNYHSGTFWADYTNTINYLALAITISQHFMKSISLINPNLNHRETEAQTWDKTCPKSLSKAATDLGLEPRFPESQSAALTTRPQG